MPSPITSPQRVRLFKSERLEKLTIISPRTFALSWAVMLPLIAWTEWGSATLLEGVALVGAGLLVWALFEYAMHRFLFHLETELPVVQWLVYLIHGNHHENPNDPMRGLMPLPVSVSIGALVWVALASLLGTAGTWVFLGFMSGYVLYDSVHYACHQWPMRTGIGAALKRHHMRHHYVDENGNYAISAIFLDRLLGSRIKSLKR